MTDIKDQPAITNDKMNVFLTGLTKREYFSGLAMQGMLANNWVGYAKESEECDALAEAAVNFADALINALQKPTT